MTAEKKIAQKRLTLLQVAERIRNVSAACRIARNFATAGGTVNTQSLLTAVGRAAVQSLTK